MEKSLYLDLDSEKPSGCQLPFFGQIIVPSGHGFKLETFELPPLPLLLAGLDYVYSNCLLYSSLFH